MKLEEMKAKKAEYGLTLEMIAENSGVPLGTVQKIFGGATQTPRRQTMEAIEAVFLVEEAKRRKRRYDFLVPSSKEVREPVVNYSVAEKEKRYTIEDYYALPDDVRAELIDGKFYYMTAPATEHQLILGELHILFRQCADAHGLPCTVLCSPCDVWLDRDDYTMVQPDLLVICSDELGKKRIEGAPDFVLEILSDSTRDKDMTLKLYKYRNAGVREYWVVDPKKKVVIVHPFEKEDYIPEIYSFADMVPVHISKGECAIDFSKVEKQLKKFGW